nr:MAG TPA: TATA element modulatory factor 1 [Caudoviricetes sp.]
MQWFKTRKRLIKEIDLLTSENERASKALLEKTATVNALLRAMRCLDYDLKKAESRITTLQGQIKALESAIAERDFMEGFMEDDEGEW